MADIQILTTDELTVDSLFTSLGQDPVDQTVELRIDGTTVDTAQIQLDAASAGLPDTEQTLRWQPSASDTGTRTVTVASNQETATRTVAVESVADFSLSLDSVDSIAAGEVADVTVSVTNTGTLSGSAAVVLNVAGEFVQRETPTVGGGETVSVTLSYDSPPSSSLTDQPATVGVAKADDDSGDNNIDGLDGTLLDSVSTTIPITTDPTFTPSIVETNSPQSAGSAASVTADISNAGPSVGQASVELQIDGTVEDTATTPSIDVGDTERVTLTWDTAASVAPGSYEATVVTPDESVSQSVEILPPGTYEVSITDVTTPVAATETATITADISNTAGIDGLAQDVTLTIGNVGAVATTSVTLTAGQTQTVELPWTPTASQFGTFDATVATADDSATEELTVEQPPVPFDVAITGATTPVEGDFLDVTATVENTGSQQDSQEITLDVGALGTDSTDVTVAPGASTEVSFLLGTESGDVGTYTATVASATDTASTGVAVVSPASFSVDVTAATTTPVEGEPVEVSATVTNTGGSEGSQEITLDAGLLGSDSTDVTLFGGNSTDLTFTVETSVGDAGAYGPTVSSADDSVPLDVNVLPSDALAVSDVSATTPVEGADLTVTATVQNTGASQATQTLDVSVGALGSVSRSVTVAAGASTTESVSLSTGGGDAGEFTATVSTADDSETETVTVLSPATFETSIVQTATAVEGEPLSVTAVVENTGAVEGTQSVDLSVGALGTDSTEITLVGDASTEVTLSVPTTEGDAGAYTATVSSADTSVSANVSVVTAGAFAVDITSTNTPVAGNALDVTVGIENTGGTEATRSIAVDVGALGSTSTDVTLAGGATTEEVVSVPTTSDDAGTYQLTASSQNATATTIVEVLEPSDPPGEPPGDDPAEFAVDITASTDVVAGQSLPVTASVENTGGATATQPITLSVGDIGSTSSEVTLDGGASTEVTLSLQTAAGDDGFYTATVSSADASDSALVSVNTPGALTVTITSVTEPVVGSPLTVTASITNTATVEQTEDITLDAEELGTDTTTVTLTAGSSTEQTLSVPTSTGDAGLYTATVESEEGSAFETVTVDPPSELAVDIVDTNTPSEGSPVEITAGVENRGETELTQTIDVDVGVLGTASTEVTLAGGISSTVTLSVPTDPGDAGEYTATVSSADDTATGTVSVVELAPFDVAIVTTTTPVEGDPLSVTATITNTGPVAGTRDITLSLGSVASSTTPVSLAGGASKDVSLSVGTAVGDAGTYTATVASDNNAASETVTLREAPVFDVSITSIDSPAAVGAETVVGYQVTNTGDVVGTQDVALSVAGSEEAVQTRTVGGGETVNNEFTYTATADDIPEVSVTVASPDTSVTETLVVTEPVTFAVSISGDSSVLVGETATVIAEITNTGGQTGTQDIEFAVDDAVEDTISNATLKAGQTVSRQFTYTPVPDDTPEISVTVSSADESASETVGVDVPAAFTVSLRSVSSPVTEGETVRVPYEVTNTGDVTETQDIEFAVDGTVVDTKTGVTLEGGDTDFDRFEHDTVAGDSPSVEVTVSAANDAASETVIVNTESVFAVSITSIDDTVTVGDTLSVSYEVTNTGDLKETQDIDFDVNGIGEGSEADVSLAPDETFSGQFTYTTEADDAPSVGVALSTGDDSTTETVVVNAPSFFEVTFTSVPDAVTAGESLPVEFEVRNTGGVTDTQDIDFAASGQTIGGVTNVTLAGGEVVSKSFTYETAVDDVPEVLVGVLTEDDTPEQSVTVNQPAAFDVTITGVADAVTAGEQLIVDVEVTNTGDVVGTQDITLSADGTVEATESALTLEGGDTETVQFTYDTVVEDAPSVTVGVSSADVTTSTSVDVRKPATFDVTVTSISDTVTVGDDITAAYEVTNTGDVVGTQDITFAVGVTTEATEAGVQLSPGETFSGQFTYTVVAGDVPSVATTVSTVDDAVSNTVTVEEVPSFAVAIDGTNTPVEGEQLTVSATVENTLDTDATQTVTLDVGAVGSDSVSVTRAAGETGIVPFAVGTGPGDAGSYTATVSGADDSATTSVTVDNAPTYGITIQNDNSPVGVGDTLSVTATVANVSGISGLSVPVELVLEDGSDGLGIVASKDVAVAAGQSQTVTLAFTPDSSDIGAYTARVQTTDDDDTTPVEIQGDSPVTVTIESTTSPTGQGDAIDVTARVDNPDSTDRTVTTELFID